jgi:hypothetical protein
MTMDMTCIGEEFQKALFDIIVERKPDHIVETGTYFGNGSTRCMIDALKKTGKGRIITIEANPTIHLQAIKNLSDAIKDGICISLLGNALHANRYKTRVDIADELVVFSKKTHSEIHDKASLFFKAGFFPKMESNMLWKAITMCNGHADLIMLDANGFGGTDEYDYVMEINPTPFILAIDDINEIKHFKTMKKIALNSRAKILKQGNERWGYAIIAMR